MNNLRNIQGLADGGRSGRKLIERSFNFFLVAALALFTAGCLVGNDEYDQASRERDDYRSQLQSLRLSNDQMNKDISQLYADCDSLNSQLSVLAALSIHDKYTEGLRRVETPAPTPTSKPGQTTRPSRGERVRVDTRPSGQSGGGSRGTGSTRGSGGGQQPSGGASTPPPPPPPPSGGRGGSIDWGF